MPRPYRLKRRAERQEETRRRIVDATVDLHRTVGPSRTTVSAIAERAGVQRLTVYRHFPDERALMLACSGQFMAENPPPNPESWLSVEDERERFRTALGELYEYYERTEAMMSSLLRDRPSNAIVDEMLKPYDEYLSVARDILSQGWSRAEDRTGLFSAAISHALDFYTWRSLRRAQGLSPEDSIELMSRSVTALVEG